MENIQHTHIYIYTGTGCIKFEVPNRHPREDVKQLEKIESGVQGQVEARTTD